MFLFIVRVGIFSSFIKCTDFSQRVENYGLNPISFLTLLQCAFHPGHIKNFVPCCLSYCCPALKEPQRHVSNLLGSCQSSGVDVWQTVMASCHSLCGVCAARQNGGVVFAVTWNMLVSATLHETCLLCEVALNAMAVWWRETWVPCAVTSSVVAPAVCSSVKHDSCVWLHEMWLLYTTTWNGVALCSYLRHGCC